MWRRPLLQICGQAWRGWSPRARWAGLAWVTSIPRHSSIFTRLQRSSPPVSRWPSLMAELINGSRTARQFYIDLSCHMRPEKPNSLKEVTSNTRIIRKLNSICMGGVKYLFITVCSGSLCWKQQHNILHGQVNLKSCCVVPEELSLFVKENGVTLLTHSDPSEILPEDGLRWAEIVNTWVNADIHILKKIFMRLILVIVRVNTYVTDI